MPTTTYRDFRVVLQLKQEWAITSGPRARIDHPFDDVVERMMQAPVLISGERLSG